ncbi:MAG: ATP-binding protein [Pseudomonadota bacterium]
MLQKLWYDRPVRTQLIVVVATVNLCAALIAGAVSVLNTRTATTAEMEASLEVAERFVDVTMRDLATHGKLDDVETELPPLLRHLRHVRIMFMSPSGELAIISPQGDTTGTHEVKAPDWYVALVRPEVIERTVRLLPDGSHPVIILGEPADEINEAWQDFSSLALIWLAINLVVLVILYLAVSRVLGPLASLSKGMHQLEYGEYGARLPPSKIKELSVIADRFNTLASALDVARKENESLYQQLISVQEAERREIANELHDEAGACLFGIAANASSIQKTAGQLTGKDPEKITNRAGEILSIAERLKSMNRELLKKLRPGPLGQVKLSDLVVELTAGLQSSHPDTQIHTRMGALAKSYGEPIDLTIYRCIQEAITNAIRHGHAGNIQVDLSERPLSNGGSANNEVCLAVADDGGGVAGTMQKGFGLTTMTERVRSLGGICMIDSGPAKGTTVRIEIPISETKNQSASARASEPAGELI